MKKTPILLILIFTPFHTYADRYIEDGLGSSSGGFFDIIIGVVCIIGALYYFVNSFSEWKVRRSKGEKPESIDSIAQWMFFIFAYAFISAFACIPLILILKIIGGASFVKEYWYWGFILCFSALIYLKRS
ncbi:MULTISPECIES: putative four-helix membrane protein [Acinetobacter]|uniref:putative four-helix membrane protein n=1 Tax=Acinetobacter TaxID=469 RepID=UPI0009D77D2E|nr:MULTISPECIES: putative four-helix membrane protein [Acinetobacter]MCU4601665.1 hypothetical protein [Acinetobacter ursingii]UYF80068.1 hypothetical protein LSO59_05955 [Acinetobacter ursingii]